SRRKLLRIFQVPGLVMLPAVFLYAAVYDLELLQIGIFLVGFMTVGQFSFWGNYLPRAYPVHLRGTGESFAANVGGRMIGTSAAFVTTNWLAPMMSTPVSYHKIALGAAWMALLVYGIGLIVSFFLPEPSEHTEWAVDCYASPLRGVEAFAITPSIVRSGTRQIKPARRTRQSNERT